jgi:hypothetical protein
MEKWEEGYYITAMAGSATGSSLVVMSKGTPYTQQSYKVSDSFPFKWINKKWKEGFFGALPHPLLLRPPLLLCPRLVLPSCSLRVARPPRPSPSPAVTAMATSHSRWAVVMSRNAGFVDQVRGCGAMPCKGWRLLQARPPLRRTPLG